MKILQLLEYIQTTISDKNYKSSFQTPRWHNKIEGNGYYSSVKADKTDPHLIVKYNRHFVNDPYHGYIKEVIDNDLASSNIHFPRVYNVKRVKDKDGKVLHKYNMERLVPMQSLDEDVQQTIIEENFNDNDGTMTAQECAEYMDYVVRYGTKSNKANRIKSESLLEALHALYIMRTNYGWDVDLHSHNFMIRTTPVGHQIVLTDPFG